MNKLNYIAHTLLNTKYKIVLLLMLYFICIKLHYIDNTYADCMRGFSFSSRTSHPEYEQALKNEIALYEQSFKKYTLEEHDEKIKKFLNEKIREYYSHSYSAARNSGGTMNTGYHYSNLADEARKTFDTVNPYLNHVLEHKQNYDQLAQRSSELENIIANLENIQKPYQATIQRMQAQDISKIKNIIYDFLPLREENYILQQRINDLEAQKFSLEFKNKQLLHNYKELNQQLSTKDTLINELQYTRTTASTSTDVTQQLHEIRTSLQNLTERLNAQEANIHNRSNINSETITSTNNCTIN